jgi:nicotinamide-nucleotide amidase
MELRKKVLEGLRERELTISTAESCTGGLVAAALTDLSGSSSVFKGSVVSYWTEIKADVLGVSRETLEQFGAVSPQTAREMAERVRSLMDTDLALSVTGVAGPDRDERGNPVGCVYIALAEGENTIVRKPENLGATREEIRKGAVQYALNLILEYLNG